MIPFNFRIRVLVLAASLGCASCRSTAPDDPDQEAGVADTGVDDDGDSGEETGQPVVDTAPDTAPDTAIDTAPDTGADTGFEYPVEPPEWPDCGTLVDPMEFGGDGPAAFHVVATASPGHAGPIFGMLSAFNFAANGDCEGHSLAGEVATFTGSCTTPDGTTLAGDAQEFISETTDDWWGTASDFVYVNSNGSGWEGSGAWTQDFTDSGGDLSWTASGYDFTTAAPEWGPSSIRGGFYREDSGSRVGATWTASGYVNAIALMDLYEGEFCYAYVMVGDSCYAGPGVLRVIGTERIEVVLTTENTGFYMVDGGAPIVF